MTHQTIGMATPFGPAMASRAAWRMSRWVWESVTCDPSVMQILAGEIAHSILIDPHPNHARGSFWGVAPRPKLTDRCNDSRVESMLISARTRLSNKSI
jgi:hypothetical protein